jgi:periplasmic protein TonB
MTRRGMVLVAIILLHLFIFWALATGLAQRAIEMVAPPIQTDIVKEEDKKVEPPPPPPPQFEKPPVEIPPPDVTIDLPVETQQTTAITNVTTQHVAAAPPTPKAVNRTAMTVDVKHFPNSADYYPPASQRLGEEGTPIVHICLGPDGKLGAAPTIATGSGSARLDAAAVDLVKAGARYIKPATEDGKPIAACTDLRIKFQMTK